MDHNFDIITNDALNMMIDNTLKSLLTNALNKQLIIWYLLIGKLTSKIKDTSSILTGNRGFGLWSLMTAQF